MKREVTVRDLMEFIVEQRAPNLPATALADVLDRLIWCLGDNGAQIESVREEWLRSDDIERVAIALAMDEIFPFPDEAEMRRELGRIAERWPEFRARCEELVDARKK